MIRISQQQRALLKKIEEMMIGIWMCDYRDRNAATMRTECRELLTSRMSGISKCIEIVREAAKGRI